VAQAVAMRLEAIDEQDGCACSDGLRPGRTDRNFKRHFSTGASGARPLEYPSAPRRQVPRVARRAAPGGARLRALWHNSV